MYMALNFYFFSRRNRNWNWLDCENAGIVTSQFVESKYWSALFQILHIILQFHTFLPFNISALSETDRRAPSTSTKMMNRVKTISVYKIQSQMFDHIYRNSLPHSLCFPFLLWKFFALALCIWTQVGKFYQPLARIVKKMNGTLKGVKWMKSRQFDSSLSISSTACGCLAVNSSERKRKRSSISAPRVSRTAERIAESRWEYSVGSYEFRNFRRRISGNRTTYVRSWRRMKQIILRKMKKKKKKRGILNVCQGKSVVVCRYSVVCLCSFGGQPSQLER